MEWANNSFPVPLSPRRSTVELVRADFSARLIHFFYFSLFPIISSKEYLLVVTCPSLSVRFSMMVVLFFQFFHHIHYICKMLKNHNAAFHLSVNNDGSGVGNNFRLLPPTLVLWPKTSLPVLITGQGPGSGELSKIFWPILSFLRYACNAGKSRVNIFDGSIHIRYFNSLCIGLK